MFLLTYVVRELNSLTVLTAALGFLERSLSVWIVRTCRCSCSDLTRSAGRLTEQGMLSTAKADFL